MIPGEQWRWPFCLLGIWNFAGFDVFSSLGWIFNEKVDDILHLNLRFRMDISSC